MKIFVLLLTLTFIGCTTTTVQTPKSKWRVMSNSTKPTAPETAKSDFVPSGTELIFTQEKHFNAKDNQINIELSPEKRCTLSSAFDKNKEVSLSPNTILTVVGYRGETNELVLSESSYNQYYLSCLSKEAQKRKVSSKPSKPTAAGWKKISIEMSDIQKMAPLIQVKYIPQ